MSEALKVALAQIDLVVGDARPIAAIQPGMTASGKKLPPAISNGNTSSVETTPAVFWLLNSICSAPNQANSATPEITSQASDTGKCGHAISW